jgi:energy-coupling factor transporter ATP-binding protein EcfA2
MELIRLENICKTYHLGEVDVPVLRGISFTIHRGELVALMGASGSGKSTLMNILGCLDRPTDGSYVLDGREIGNLSADERAIVRTEKLGFAEQLAPEMPTVEQLGIRSVFKGWPTFTPDGRFIIGESSQVKGFVMAGGCNAHGVSGSAGIGRHVVESILDPDPSPYVKSLSPDRFNQPWSWESVQAKAQQIYETYYDLGH